MNNSDICFVPKPIPDGVIEYIVLKMKDAPGGRDGHFCSPYVEKILNQFSWDDRRIEKPDLVTFSRWVMSICKRGLNKDGERNYQVKSQTICDEVKKEVIEKVESLVGKIQDSFMGSPKFFEIYEELGVKYNLSKWHFAEILISRRKQVESTIEGYIYAFRPTPRSKPYTVKLGFSSKKPEKRMFKSVQNTASEKPEMIGYFRGNKNDEKNILALFSCYNIRGNGNKEMFKFPDLNEIISYIREKGGNIEKIIIPDSLHIHKKQSVDQTDLFGLSTQ